MPASLELDRIAEQIRQVRLQRKKLEEEEKEATKTSSNGVKKKKFVSGVKPDLYHPNLDYAMAELSYSPYLNGHMPHNIPDMKSLELMNKMRFMGPKKCEKEIEKGLILPCNIQKKKTFVEKVVMTYNPDFAPAEAKRDDRSSTANSSKRPNTSLSTDKKPSTSGSRLLEPGSTTRARSPIYRAANARGGPEVYMKKLKEKRMEKHAEFESEFLGLFASDSSMESGFDMPPDPNNKKKKGKELAVRKIKYDCNGWKKNPILLE